jgi:hypothetical protein
MAASGRNLIFQAEHRTYDHHMRLLLIWILASVLPAMAEPAKRRTCRIVFPERPNDAPKVAYLFDGKDSRQVTLPSMNFSEVIDLPSGELTLLMTRDEITDPGNLPQSAPKLKIAENVGGDFYILITPDPSNPALPLQMNMVDYSNGKLKPGETLWFNRTDHLIVAKLGESKLSVPPHSLAISKNPASSNGYYKAEFAYQPNAQGNFRRITEQQWWHDSGSRHVGFMVNTGGILPSIYFFRDFR